MPPRRMLSNVTKGKKAQNICSANCGLVVLYCMDEIREHFLLNSHPESKW
jgi:hypothetical protein